jgi:hypothetical protein
MELIFVTSSMKNNSEFVGSEATVVKEIMMDLMMINYCKFFNDF